ncbi:MAG: hypothetical protein WC979_08805 [Candidatus Pacearchaeota archaeon]|jgi:hypothetical protein
MTNTIENNVEASLKDLDIQNGLDPEIMKQFRDMNSREFVQYLIEGGNHQAEIRHYLTKSMHPNYVNSVLLTLTEELWFNQNRLKKIRAGPLNMFYSQSR